jgi:SAM-dependent methyltransferase
VVDLITMKWASLPDIESPAFYALHRKLHDLEDFIPTYRHDSDHMGRQFEYPWAILNANLTKGDKILNAGSGTDVMGFFLSLFGPTINLDINPAVIKQGVEQAGGMFSNLEFKLGDMGNLPYADGYFDKGFCISAIEHGERSVENYYRELLRVIRPGGVLLLTVDIERELNHLNEITAQQVFGQLPPKPNKVLALYDPQASIKSPIFTLGIKVTKE